MTTEPGAEEQKTKETNMRIGEMIEALENGRWTRRAGWNGKGMHLYLEEAHTERYPRIKGDGEHYLVAAYIVLFNAQGVRQPGWNASTPDLLAKDWELVPEEEMR